MEPVEINAGAWYLRGVRSDAGYAWEVCEPITGEVVAEVTLDPDAATMSSRRARPCRRGRGRDEAVRRFAEAALGITVRD